MPPIIPLAGDFPRASESDWRTLATRPGAGSIQASSFSSIDGLPISPIYPPGHGPVLPMRPPGPGWTAVQRIDNGGPSAVRTTARTAVRGGANGIEFVFAGSPAAHGRGLDPGFALSEVVSDTAAVVVRIDAGEATPQLASRLVASGIELVSAYDAVSTLAAHGGLDQPLARSVAEIATLIGAMNADGRLGVAFIADGRPWHDAGASEVQELAAMLASAVETLRQLGQQGVEPAQAARRLGVALSADSDQFLTIAKLRAIRSLFARLFEVAGIEPARLPVHAETAWRMQSQREPTMNMVRATTATFAAAVGGADSITVLPPLLDVEAFGNRMARNTQTILREESSLHRAGDPGAGSGAIETLTGELAEAAWDVFTQIETEGGLAAALGSGSIQRAVAAMRDARLAKVARRTIHIVGVNIHVDRTSPLPRPTAWPGADRRNRPVTPLRPIRLAEPLEALWARAAPIAGERASVMLVNLGRVPEDDVASAADAFAAGGLEVLLDEGHGPGLRDAFARSTARVACILAGKNDSEPAAALAAELRQAGARAVVGAGLLAAAAGAEDFDALLLPDTDIVALISGILDRIAEVDQNGQS